jgi:SigmaK-factor processing regulatory protein BofA
MEPVILIILVVLVLVVLGGRGMGSLSTLVVNGLVGIVLLFLTNLFVSPPIPINIITVLICAIGGVVGWLLILILHILGIAFYVAV